MHLLLVEDDLDLGAEIQRALQGRGFSSVWLRCARDARAHLAQAEDAAIACVLLDLGLPDGEGLDLLKELRASGSDLPVIVLSARDALHSRVAGLDAGADDYLIKPIEPAELASRIRAVTRRVGGHSSQVWSVAGLQIDTGRREVQIDGDVIGLSPKEFMIVAELARHAGRVLPKHRLARSLAPLGEPLEFNALEVHVHNLRRKLGADTIRTVRGVGYVLGG